MCYFKKIEKFGLNTIFLYHFPFIPSSIASWIVTMSGTSYLSSTKLVHPQVLSIIDPHNPGVKQGQPWLTPGLTLGSSRVDLAWPQGWPWGHPGMLAKSSLNRVWMVSVSEWVWVKHLVSVEISKNSYVFLRIFWYYLVSIYLVLVFIWPKVMRMHTS